MLITRHRVPVSAFAMLSRGRANAEVMDVLRAGRLSKQTLLIRAVCDAARPFHRAVATAGLEDAVQVIDEAQRRSPAAAADVLGYPLVGAWAAHCLRRLRHRTDGGTPLWVDLAHLTAVAAAMAIRAGIDVTLPVPVRRGAVSLPTLGCARLASGAEWGTATFRGSTGAYTVSGLHNTVAVMPDPEQDSPEWQAVHRLTLTDRGQTMTVFLDDLDPYRSHGLRCAGRLDARAQAAWHAQLAQAWAILVRNHPERVAELSAGPVTVVPLGPAAAGAGGTTRDSAGAMALALPSNPFSLAMSVVHEFQHSKLRSLLDLVELYDPAERRRFYSPWRPDPRPVGGVLQGAYAFQAVGALWGRHATRDTGVVSRRVAEYEFARARQQLRTALQELTSSGALTAAGSRFVAGLAEVAGTLASRRVPEGAARMARLACDDHRVSWRLRNVRVEPGTLAALAVAWHAPAPPITFPPPTPVAGGPLSNAEQPRNEHIVRMLDDPQASGTGSDAALVAGDYEAAARGYLAAIRSEPGRYDLWTGLAVARLRTGPPGLAHVYATEPELLAALYARLTMDGAAVEPDALALWLAD